MVNQLYCGLLFCGSLLLVQASDNLLQNPGFEESSPFGAAHWANRPDSAAPARLVETDAHSGQRSLELPTNSAVEQSVTNLPAGPYLVRCWVKSSADQSITVVVQDPDAPAAAYTYADLQVAKGRWVQVETFCALDHAGSLALTLGGMSSEFRRYHGGTSEMRAPVLIDDCELIRFDRKSAPAPRVWDAGQELADELAWSHSVSWPPVQESTHSFTGTPVIQASGVAGAVQTQDGGLRLYALADGMAKTRALLEPKPSLEHPKSSLVRGENRTGLRVSSAQNDRSYTVWLSAEGVIDIEAHGIAEFSVQDCQLRYGLLPSFVGTDICYDAEQLAGSAKIRMPSAQWFVGLREGGESMLVLVWRSASHATSLELSGTGRDRLIQGISIDTQEAGFSLGLVEHPNLWGQAILNEDWLGEYTPLAWQRPFPARWMAHFFVTTGGKAAFRTPHMSYAFPIANAKTRMWGVWFEDWNHYPFFFEGSRLVAHFEKTFVPNGNAIFYYLEPAAADVLSPCEIVEQVLGQEKAAGLFDLGGNQLRKLPYSTPPEFIYDRPVCATTTRLASIRREEKPTVGVNLATHLFEFIRGIRGRVDQYVVFFNGLDAYFAAQEQAHPEAHTYIAPLHALTTEGLTRAKDAYETPLSVVRQKTDAMQKLLEAGKGDGFDCGSLDVRGPAGTQDDLCRRYNRLVLRLCETAALTCGDSAENAVIATHVWQQSHEVLRQPTRWEPRRTLYFFEP